MPRKPTDESNSPRGGRARKSVGRSSGRDRPDRGTSAARGSSAGRGASAVRGGRGAERSGSPRGGQRSAHAEGAPRRGGTDRGSYPNIRTPGDRPFGGRPSGGPSRRPSRTGPSDRSGPYEGPNTGARGAGARRSDRPRSPEWTSRRGGSGDAGRPERRPFGDRKPAVGAARNPRFSESDRRPPRRGPGEAPGRPPRAGSESRDTRRGRSESGDERRPRRPFSEAREPRGPRQGPREGGEGRKAESSVWDSAPSRRRARPNAPRDEGASRGRFSGKRAGGGKERPPRREKRESAYGSRAPLRGRPQDSSPPEASPPEASPPEASPPEASPSEAEKLDTAPSSWSGNPSIQHEGEALQTPQVDEAAPDQEHDSDDGQPARGGGGRGRQERGEGGERLQKVLSRAGVGSRREVEEWIRAGRITVNGEPAVLGVRVGPSDKVRLDGRLIRQRETGGAARVFLIHRSPGENLQQPVESSDQSDESDEAVEEGEGAEETRGSSAQSFGTPLLDRMPRRAGRRFIPVSPMPRVDGGLELVTSDGDLASKLQRSMRRLSSEFSVRVHGELSPQGIETISRGELDNGQKLAIERCEAGGGEGTNRWYSLVARGASGKDVRQLFERQGALVSRVLRTQLGSLALDRLLSRGQFRELTAEELEALLAAAEV